MFIIFVVLLVSECSAWGSKQTCSAKSAFEKLVSDALQNVEWKGKRLEFIEFPDQSDPRLDKLEFKRDQMKSEKSSLDSLCNSKTNIPDLHNRMITSEEFVKMSTISYENKRFLDDKLEKLTNATMLIKRILQNARTKVESLKLYSILNEPENLEKLRQKQKCPIKKGFKKFSENRYLFVHTSDLRDDSMLENLYHWMIKSSDDKLNATKFLIDDYCSRFGPDSKGFEESFLLANETIADIKSWAIENYGPYLFASSSPEYKTYVSKKFNRRIVNNRYPIFFVKSGACGNVQTNLKCRYRYCGFTGSEYRDIGTYCLVTNSESKTYTAEKGKYQFIKPITQ